jgi:hypothetical protein
MKKIILFFALVLAIGISGSFANDSDGIAQTVKSSFSRDFKSATNVRWQQNKDFDKATFNLDNQVLFAYYDPTGFLIAVSKNIISENLPIKLQTGLKNNYCGFWIVDLFENASNNETTYYITLENADQKLILQSDNSSDWSLYQRIHKDVE